MNRTRNNPTSYVYINNCCSRPRRARLDTVFTVTHPRCRSNLGGMAGRYLISKNWLSQRNHGFPIDMRYRDLPLSREYGIYKAVMPRFWSNMAHIRQSCPEHKSVMPRFWRGTSEKKSTWPSEAARRRANMALTRQPCLDSGPIWHI